MANSEHVDWLWKGVASWNQRRRDNPFTPDLSSEDISIKLGGHEREDIRQISVDLKGINLSGANLSDATLWDTDLTDATFLESKLIRAKLIGSNFTGATFVGGSIRGAQLRSSKLTGGKFFCLDLRLWCMNRFFLVARLNKNRLLRRLSTTFAKKSMPSRPRNRSCPTYRLAPLPSSLAVAPKSCTGYVIGPTRRPGCNSAVV
jgi:hypothetical protein